MYCKKCGAEIKENSAYCPKCGVKIRHKEEIPEVPYSYEQEESGINGELEEPGNKRIKWLVGGILGVVFVAVLGILSWKILKPSDPDTAEPTVKIGEAVAQTKSESQDGKSVQSGEETGKQENIESNDTVSVEFSLDSGTVPDSEMPDSETNIPEGMSESETGISTSEENTPESGTSELAKDESIMDSGVSVRLNEEEASENIPEQNRVSGSTFILETAEPDLTTLREAGVITANATSTFAQPDTDHSPMLLFDKKDNTFWQEGIEGSGKGESVSFGLDNTYQIRYLGFKLGNWTDDQHYTESSKPKTVTFTAGDSSGQVTFTGDKKAEWVKIDPPVTADTVLLKINDVYAGTAEDTCITEIMVYGK